MSCLHRHMESKSCPDVWKFSTHYLLKLGSRGLAEDRLEFGEIKRGQRVRCKAISRTINREVRRYPNHRPCLLASISPDAERTNERTSFALRRCGALCPIESPPRGRRQDKCIGLLVLR